MRAFCLRCDACQKKCALISSLCNTKVFLWKSSIIRIQFFSPFTLAALCGVAISTTERNRSWRIRYDRQIYTALAETALEMFSKEGITTPLSIVVLFNLPRRYDTSSDWSTIRNWIAWYAMRTFVHMFCEKPALCQANDESNERTTERGRANECCRGIAPAEDCLIDQAWSCIPILQACVNGALFFNNTLTKKTTIAI